MPYVDEVIERVIRENPDEPEFHQAVTEVLESLRPVIDENEQKYRKDAIINLNYSRMQNCDEFTPYM